VSVLIDSHKSFPIQDDEHFLTVCRYAGMSSATRRIGFQSGTVALGIALVLDCTFGAETSPVVHMANSSPPQRDRTSQSTADRKGTGCGPRERQTRMSILRFRRGGIDRQTIWFAVHLATPRKTTRQKSTLDRHIRVLTPLISLNRLGRVNPVFRQMIRNRRRSSPDDPCDRQSNFRRSSPHAPPRPRLRVIAIFYVALVRENRTQTN
jgi:hypothetical protein